MNVTYYDKLYVKNGHVIDYSGTSSRVIDVSNIDGDIDVSSDTTIMHTNLRHKDLKGLVLKYKKKYLKEKGAIVDV